MFIAFIVIIGLSVLILGHELGHFFVAKSLGLRVDEFGFGFPPRIAAIKRGETEYSLNWLPFGGFVKIAGEDGEEGAPALTHEEKKRLFSYQKARRRIAVLVAGVATNFILGWWFFSAALMMGIPPAIVITGTAPESPASKAELVMGDVFLGFGSAKEFIEYVGAHKGQPADFSVLGAGGERKVSMTPRSDPPEGEGALGVAFAESGEPAHGFFSALWKGLNRTVEITWLTLVGMGTMLYGLIAQHPVEGMGSVVGPVGIITIAQHTGQIGFAYLLELVGLISINLAIINLIPFPALDGGRILFIAIEKIKGTPIPRHVEGIANGVGFLALIALMVFVTVRDVARWF
ncbi:MAG: site-2 protease family protein [Patescibacteria group bacterium]|nr:site-2 protease family protein [Patescibacteria group bacterium]